MLAFVRKIRKIANLMTGLGMIFVGLKMMSSACDDQSIRDAFSNVLKNLEFPLLLELLGIIFTAIIQSSSAMTGIVIVMVGKKAMTIRNGLFITLGANIGTCVTAMIGIIGANTNSKRTALIHLIFNVSGCIIFTPILWIFSDSIVNILSKMSNEDAQRIAFFHLFFNIATAIITTPLIKFLVKFVSFVIKNKDKPEKFLEWFIKDKEDKDEGLLNPRPSSNSVNINIINEENAIIDTNQSESNDDTIIKEDKLIKDDSNKAQNLIIKDDIKKDENKILINNNEKENDKMIN
jgi:phosphate:Na+ symporter